MSKKFLNDIDMDQNEILNMRVQNLSSAPSNPKEGQLYYNNMDKLTYQYNGTSWIPLIMSNSDIPVGSIYEFGGSAAPDGYLICNGSAISRTDYSELFAVIGTSYGSGDGSTTFNLPDLRSRVPIGLDSRDSDFDILGETGGEKTHTLSVNEIPSHSHDLVYVKSNSTPLNYAGVSGFNPNNTGVGTKENAVENAGGGQAHNNVQPYQVVNYIIKYQSSTSNALLKKVYSMSNLADSYESIGQTTVQAFIRAWFGEDGHTATELKPIIMDIATNKAILYINTSGVTIPVSTDFRAYNENYPFGYGALRLGWYNPVTNSHFFMYFRFVNAATDKLMAYNIYSTNFSDSLITTNDNKGLSLTGAKNLKDLIDDLQAQITALATKVDTQELDINGTKVLYDDGN